ncbi:hypothetical protein [Streptomyces cyaneofuscatus]|uniref:hypothetical protein n=1 Tax=Streptomyces cyaneofuscatus TaxID=66883 RepID=UPI002FEFD296
MAREVWSLRDVLAHGVIDYHSVVAGRGRGRSRQQWFEAGACDDFSLAIDGHYDCVDAFVDQVVPSCRIAACSASTTKAPPCATSSTLASSTASTRASRKRCRVM